MVTRNELKEWLTGEGFHVTDPPDRSVESFLQLNAGEEHELMDLLKVLFPGKLHEYHVSPYGNDWRKRALVSEDRRTYVVWAFIQDNSRIENENFFINTSVLIQLFSDMLGEEMYRTKTGGR